MSNEKKLHSRLERLMAGLGGVARDGAPRPEPEPPAAALGTPGAPIDPHAVVPGWTWEADAQGRYTACSPEVTTLLGFDPAGLIGQPLTQIAVASDSAGRRELAGALKSERPLLDLRLEARAPDGSARVVVLNGMPLFDERDQFQGYRGVAHVVSELDNLPAMARSAAPPAPPPMPPLARPPAPPAPRPPEVRPAAAPVPPVYQAPARPITTLVPAARTPAPPPPAPAPL